MAAAVFVCALVSAESIAQDAQGPQLDFSQTAHGDPLQNLPDGARLISGFGERPVFSPDGSRIAFIGQTYGDAFEYDIASGTVRNLTGHTAHSGFLRVHYLPDGSYLLLGPRRLDDDRQAMRIRKIELWYMDKGADGPILPLHTHVSEGIALSRETNRVAWVELDPLVSTPEQDVDEHTILKVGDLVVHDGVPAMENVREIARRSSDQCVLEAQDFRDGDREVLANCYDLGGLKLSRGKFGHIEHSIILGVPVDGGEVNTYWDVRDGTFMEAEGIGPGGGWTLLDCGPGYGGGLDVCRLGLEQDRGRLTRVTRFMDYGDHRISNAVVSPDGKLMAFQFGRGGDEAGVGMGILIMPMPGSGAL
jgi:WD40 repeat protein